MTVITGSSTASTTDSAAISVPLATPVIHTHVEQVERKTSLFPLSLMAYLILTTLLMQSEFSYTFASNASFVTVTFAFAVRVKKVSGKKFSPQMKLFHIVSFALERQQAVQHLMKWSFDWAVNLVEPLLPNSYTCPFCGRSIDRF